ncbi:MAG: hypothetical protein AAFZ92_09990 [Pseudomonadota bacterium]
MATNNQTNASQRLRQELAMLANLAKNQTGRDFNVKKSKDMLALFKWASQESSPAVQQELERIGGFVSPGHKRFFEQNGISFDGQLIVEKQISEIKRHSSGSYRGASVDHGNSSNNSNGTGGDEPPPGKKKKIVYRGQVKWV